MEYGNTLSLSSQSNSTLKKQLFFPLRPSTVQTSLITTNLLIWSLDSALTATQISQTNSQIVHCCEYCVIVIAKPWLGLSIIEATLGTGRED
jgi:hypothetical protein